MDSHDAVGAIAVVLIFGFPVAAWIISRILAHNEYMAMIRMGMPPPPDSRFARRAMRQGWVPPPPPPPGATTGVTPPQQTSYDPYAYGGYGYLYGPQRQLTKGIQVAMIGLALLIGLSFIGTFSGHMLGPWLLGGLIPMFVGIAQIISAVLAGAQFGLPSGGQGQNSFGPAPGQSSNFGPPPAAGAPPPPPSSPGDIYGWRPGPTPEIQKPAPPPDQR